MFCMCFNALNSQWYEKTWIEWKGLRFFVSYETTNVSNIDHIHKCLIKNTVLYKYLDLYFPLNAIYISLVLVWSCFHGSLAINFLSMNNRAYTVMPTLTDLNHELHSYLFVIGMSRCDESWHTVKGLSGNMRIPKNLKGMKLKVCNVI